MNKSGRSTNPFDEDDGGGFGTRSSDRVAGGVRGRDPSEYGYKSRYGGAEADARGYGYGYRGYDSGPSDGEREVEARMLMANQRMENSSANSLRVLNETMRMGIDTTEELERQAESLDRTERTLDGMHVDLDQGELHLRKIKSPFGGIFTRKKTTNEVTDPKGFKPQSKGAKSKPAETKQKKQQKQQPPPQGTGNERVDRNFDEMEKALHQLKGIGEVIGTQLDDSELQLDRVGYKMDRNHVKVDKLNKGIKKELYK